MANYAQKLASMRNRRLGIDSAVAFASLSQLREATALDAVSVTEAYEKRSTSEATKYALGAMQEVGPSYTQISIQEGDRVRNQLDTGLRAAGLPATFEYQGSVPLNIHIRFGSDIDLLVLHNEFVSLDWNGPRAGSYTVHTHKKGSLLADMLWFRQKCEDILESQFPSVTVDKSGAKSIALTGGSLRRKVDVVPSQWHDTAAYQASYAKYDREVRILHRDDRTMLTNRPFLHMKQIDDKDSCTSGGAKKVIRLLKTLKFDSGKQITLSSYDIAALVWHFDNASLNKPSYLDLSLVAETQQHLQILLNHEQWTRNLDVPDGSRKIIDSPDKFSSLRQLKQDVDQLVLDIASELNPHAYGSDEVIRKSLMKAFV